MEKKRKLEPGCVGPLIAVAVICLVIVSCRQLERYIWSHVWDSYEGYANYEWEELSYYEAREDKILGMQPDEDMSTSLFSNWLYSLKGIPKNEFLYCHENNLDGSESAVILMNAECEEPSKTMSIKKITIKKNAKSKVTITNKNTLKKIQQIVRNEWGTEVSFDDTLFNATVHFDVKCDMTWSCAFRESEDGSILFTYYNHELSKYYYYDVTELLKDKF